MTETGAGKHYKSKSLPAGKAIPNEFLLINIDP